MNINAWCENVILEYRLEYIPASTPIKLQGAKVGTRIPFGTFVEPWIRVRSEHEETLVHSILVSLSKSYRKLSSHDQNNLCILYRFTEMHQLHKNHAFVFTEEERERIQCAGELDETIATKWIHALGFNALFLVEADATVDTTTCRIGMIELKKPIIENSAIILYITYTQESIAYEAVYINFMLHHEIAQALDDEEGGMSRAIQRLQEKIRFLI